MKQSQRQPKRTRAGSDTTDHTAKQARREHALPEPPKRTSSDIKSLDVRHQKEIKNRYFTPAHPKDFPSMHPDLIISSIAGLLMTRRSQHRLPDPVGILMHAIAHEDLDRGNWRILGYLGSIIFQLSQQPKNAKGLPPLICCYSRHISTEASALNLTWEELSRATTVLSDNALTKNVRIKYLAVLWRKIYGKIHNSLTTYSIHTRGRRYEPPKIHPIVDIMRHSRVCTRTIEFNQLMPALLDHLIARVAGRSEDITLIELKGALSLIETLLIKRKEGRIIARKLLAFVNELSLTIRLDTCSMKDVTSFVACLKLISSLAILRANNVVGTDNLLKTMNSYLGHVIAEKVIGYNRLNEMQLMDLAATLRSILVSVKGLTGEASTVDAITDISLELISPKSAYFPPEAKDMILEGLSYLLIFGEKNTPCTQKILAQAHDLLADHPRNINPKIVNAVLTLYASAPKQFKHKADQLLTVVSALQLVRASEEPRLTHFVLLNFMKKHCALYAHPSPVGANPMSEKYIHDYTDLLRRQLSGGGFTIMANALITEHEADMLVTDKNGKAWIINLNGSIHDEYLPYMTDKRRACFFRRSGICTKMYTIDMSKPDADNYARHILRQISEEIRESARAEGPALPGHRLMVE